jgi:xylitol oxidase
MHRPTTVEEVQAIVAAAHGRNVHVHACGSRHSFSTVADTDGEMISMAALDRIVAIDPETMTMTVEGGIRYGELSAALHARGLALHNLPSLPHITVAGAVATATHGSGDANGNLATAVRGIDLVVGDGSLVRFDRADARFAGAVVALGALGVVVRITLAVVPTFEIAQVVYRDLPFEDGLERLGDVMAAAYSVSLFTDFQRDVFQQVWWKGRVDVDGKPPASMYGATPAEVALHPVAGIAPEACTEQLGLPGPWAERLPHFRLAFTPSSGDELQSEYFVPRPSGAEALRAVRRLAADLGPLLQISEVRTVAADELWLSGAFGRETLALHFTWVPDQARVMALLPELERALAPFDARPHWGKLTAMPAETIRQRFPRWTEFERLVAAVDPTASFRNAFLAALLR